MGMVSDNKFRDVVFKKPEIFGLILTFRNFFLFSLKKKTDLHLEKVENSIEKSHAKNTNLQVLTNTPQLPHKTLYNNLPITQI